MKSNKHKYYDSNVPEYEPVKENIRINHNSKKQNHKRKAMYKMEYSAYNPNYYVHKTRKLNTTNNLNNNLTNMHQKSMYNMKYDPMQGKTKTYIPEHFELKSGSLSYKNFVKILLEVGGYLLKRAERTFKYFTNFLIKKK